MSSEVDMRKTQMPITTAQLLWQLQDKTLSSLNSIKGLGCGVLGKQQIRENGNLNSGLLDQRLFALK